MAATDLNLLGQYTRDKSQDAFTEVVNRHVNLVYSAALRQVRSPELAEEISQSVFTTLAQDARKLRPDTVLIAWLYTVTRRTAVDVIRREARRQAREQIAFEMSNLDSSSADWPQIEPLLDEAMHSLDEADRTAILLRYFENKSLRDVGAALGSSEDAAQKRVSRAVEHLRDFLSKRNIAVGTTGLIALVSTNAIQAAPAGLAASISTGAAVGAAAVSASTVATATKTIAMTTIQKTAISVVIAAAIGAGVYQANQSSGLREQVKKLEQQKAEQAALADQAARERDRVTNKVAALAGENAALKKNPAEVVKLRGEVGRLRQENENIASKSALNKITANPETRKMLRDQQKVGMGAVYKSLANRLKLSPEQTEQFNDLLADHIMENVGHVTAVLKDNMGTQEMDRLFADQETALGEKMQALLGADGLALYQEYTRNLASSLTVDQFRPSLSSGDFDEKSKKLYEAMLAETHAALASAGFPDDYQIIPILNFRNIASESEGEKSLELFDTIYENVATKAQSFLSPEELAKFQEYRKQAISVSRSALTVNRTIMAPIGK